MTTNQKKHANEVGGSRKVIHTNSSTTALNKIVLSDRHAHISREGPEMSYSPVDTQIHPSPTPSPVSLIAGSPSLSPPPFFFDNRVHCIPYGGFAVPATYQYAPMNASNQIVSDGVTWCSPVNGIPSPYPTPANSPTGWHPSHGYRQSPSPHTRRIESGSIQHCRPPQTPTYSQPILSARALPRNAVPNATLATYYPHRIFVGSLPRTCTPIELANFFRRFGTVIEAKVVLDPEGNSKGYGFVSFASPDSVAEVLKCGSVYFQNKRIAIASAIRKKFPDVQ